VRTGSFKGFLGKNLVNTLVIGIGGSYLGVEFVHEALRSSTKGVAATQGRKIKFIANVDPLDFFRAVEGLDASQTLVVINSKTFTTAETMLNARTVVDWLVNEHKKLGVKVETEEDKKKLSIATLQLAARP
jgi:glucose-6-phosphate isomerase